MFKKYLPIAAVTLLLISFLVVAAMNGFWSTEAGDPLSAPESTERDYEPEFGDSSPEPVEGAGLDGTIEIPEDEVPKPVVEDEVQGEPTPVKGYNIASIIEEGNCQGTESDGYTCEYSDKFPAEEKINTSNPIGSLLILCSGDIRSETCDDFEVDFMDFYDGRAQSNYTMGSSTITLEYANEQVSFVSMLTTESAWRMMPDKDGFYTESAGEEDLIYVYQDN